MKHVLKTLCLGAVIAMIGATAFHSKLRALAFNYWPPHHVQTIAQALEGHGLEVGAGMFLRIFKQESVLEVWAAKDDVFVLLKSYPICAWSGELGPKLKEGDGQSPEGFYRVSQGQLNPNSKFHLSFNLGFPNDFDQANDRTGSFLMVHGNCVSIGCYAMTDPAIEEIYGLMQVSFRRGQAHVPVHIFPFRMTKANMQRHTGSRWFEFWQSLKTGYDAFEADRRPPAIAVSGKSYRVSAR